MEMTTAKGMLSVVEPSGAHKLQQLSDQTLNYTENFPYNFVNSYSKFLLFARRNLIFMFFCHNLIVR